MTDQQLYLAIGLPAIIALVGVLVNAGYFVAINGRMTSTESRLDSRINLMESRLDSRIAGLESKFDTKIDLLVGKVLDMDNRLIRLEERLKH